MSSNRTAVGILLAIAAYTMWGVAPIYFKLLHGVPAAEILMHRVIWSVIVLFGLILLTKQSSHVMRALQDTNILKILSVTGFLLAANWYVFIWAINNDHLLDASLGYYINPLLNVFLGRAFLGETLRKMQKLAVILALIGVGMLVISYGHIPWVSLLLASTFGVYGLIRKKVPVGSFPGLFIESLLMLPVAVYYWLVFAGDTSNLLSNSMSLNILLICAGIITTAPLLCFTSAAKRIQYSTLGFFQYIGPSIMFVLAVLVFNEPLQQEKVILFAFVWAALAIFSWDSWRHYRRMKGAN
ncbi:EamA family transporter RarD [Paraglaciecola aquimarina]|uniref:EamA family transporter RarD n=1 Tax=Paraglaciecola aquimarina TaxID=1235557 RepID=A0ABU3SYE6_9ALTE|nr:EamA family transporter RarD [Paraglaciecola aquimarina]MDU0355023.1 EamA family transporter RarD [Paraglaciecola aquimarina]